MTILGHLLDHPHFHPTDVVLIVALLTAIGVSAIFLRNVYRKK